MKDDLIRWFLFFSISIQHKNFKFYVKINKQNKKVKSFRYTKCLSTLHTDH